MKINKKILSLIVATSFLAIPSNVFALNLKHQYINHNRSHQSLNPTGLVLHDTDNTGATAQNNHDYFNRVYVGASAHYFVDWNKAIQTIPENEVAWHAGYTANHRFLSIEMCVPKSQEEFNKVYDNTVELAAEICKRHNWTSKEIYSHRYCSYTWHQTDHEDPYDFLKQFGKSWNELLGDIDKKIAGKDINVNPGPAPQHNSINANATILASKLNVRSSAWGSVIGSVFRNERVEVLSQEGDWCYIKYNTSHGTKEGYAYKQYVRQDSISVDSRVKVISSRYATGQKIPNWVKQEKYTVMQVKGDRALLKEIMSWVYITDLNLA